MRLIFAGTPDFVITVAESLARQTKHKLVAIYTVPDTKAGRGRKLTPPALKQWALKHGLSVEQPAIWDETSITRFAEYKPDLMIVMAYGMLLPDAVLEIPRLGCINIHTSLLPRWRGAAPVIRAIEHGDELTGVSLMQMETRLDAGPVISYRGYRIQSSDTSAVVHDALAKLGTVLLGDFLTDAENKLAHAQAQTQTGVCYAHKVCKQEACIDWNQDAQTIARKIRAFNPSPVAYTSFDGKLLRLWEVNSYDGPVPPIPLQGPLPGMVIGLDRHRIIVCCGEGTLLLQRVQPAGKRIMSAADFVNGHDVIEECLG